MRYALIGCGRIASLHLSSALACSLEVVSLCDVQQTAIETLLFSLGLQNLPVKRFVDFRAMLDSCELDLVAIATDSGSHAKIAKECLKRGVAVLVEKPMALHLNDADEMIALAEKQGVPLGVCQQNRFNDATLLVREAQKREAFGRLSHVSVEVRWWRDKQYFDQSPWRGTWAKDGGALMNQCIHGLDLMRWFGGSSIERVSGVLANRYHPYLEVEDVGLGFVEFSNGALGSLEGTTNLYRENLEERIAVIGEKGTACLGGESAQLVETWQFEDLGTQDLRQKLQSQQFASVYGTSHERVYAEFLQACMQNRRPTVDGQCGRDALELVLALYKSHLDKKPISLPLHDFGTEGMHL